MIIRFAWSADRIVGVSVPRKEGRDKVTGQAQYVDDMTLPGMLYGATVRSQIPRGKIRKIIFGPEVAWDEFVIVSAKDIPGRNCHRADCGRPAMPGAWR